MSPGFLTLLCTTAVATRVHKQLSFYVSRRGIMRLSATDVQSVYPVLLQYTVYILLIYAIVNDFYKMYAYIICLLKGRWRNMHIMFILIHKYIYIHTPSVLPFWYITILQSNGFFELLPPGLCWDRVMSQ